MTAWLLRSITIEGLRGINNEGDPLVLEFDPDAINSVFAPNAVGKTSVFDALLFAIRGCIKKLDTLPASEKGKDYYRNRSTRLAWDLSNLSWFQPEACRMRQFEFRWMRMASEWSAVLTMLTQTRS